MHKNITVHTFPTKSVQPQSAELIADYLVTEIAKKRSILLLLSGGSAVGMYKELFTVLLTKIPQAKNLTVSLFDERFVAKNSVDSNEFQLKEAGVLQLIEQLSGTWITFIGRKEKNGEETASTIAADFKHALSQNSSLIVLAGIGEDGHTAGLLPTLADSSNRKKLFESNQLIEYYDVNPKDSDNPYQRRLTSTLALVQKTDQVFLYATGEKKSESLKKFKIGNAPFYQFPALALHLSKRPVIVVTDQSF